ncbi:hypothetical protein KHQ84_gp174 [Rhodococcus phage Finch]|uniref:Uncharacterized protein n=1 Tax=Rhodococcus phage Finch TaxID=2094144 RepID=A0A2P1JXL6_9CAUD|nr:hypothetical protein KHQ84_gp174 [Rhodococcus phage Finch]AVO25101.1 hypothetical protein SEA_FINCH_174 [Rhodococcus phage Finch]
MTNVTGGEELVTRHSQSIKTPCVFGDLEDLVFFVQKNGPQTSYDDRAFVRTEEDRLTVWWETAVDIRDDFDKDAFLRHLRDGGAGVEELKEHQATLDAFETWRAAGLARQTISNLPGGIQ